MDDIGSRIRELRRLKSMSQSQLGHDRYTASYISHIESGRRIPNDEVIAYLASRLGVSAETILPNRSKEHEEEIAILLHEARMSIAQGRWRHALSASLKARTLAVRLPHAVRTWEADLVYLEALLRCGKYRQVAQSAERVLQTYSINSDLVHVQIALYASRALRYLDQPLKAAQIIQTALCSVGEISADIESEALVELLTATIAQRELCDGSAIVQRLLSLSDEVEALHIYQIMKALAAYAYLRRDPMAIRYSRRALEACDPHRDLLAWTQTSLLAAEMILEFSDDYQSAYQLVKPITHIVEVCPHGLHALSALYLEARCLICAGKDDLAADLLRRALSIPGCLDPFLKAEIVRSYGEILIRQGEKETARRFLKESAELFEQADEHERALKTWHRFADI